jgi:hypothetical protein
MLRKPLKYLAAEYGTVERASQELGHGSVLVCPEEDKFAAICAREN